MRRKSVGIWVSDTNGKEYQQVRTRHENFTQLCKRISEELGETLYAVADPVLSEGKIFICAPNHCANRIMGAVCNYSGVEIIAA